MRSQLVVSIKDLQFVVLFCRYCNTRVTLDLDAEFEPIAGRAGFACPRECPRCGNPFDSAVPGAVNDIRKAYKGVAKLGNAVSFTSDAEPPHADPAESQAVDRRR